MAEIIEGVPGWPEEGFRFSKRMLDVIKAAQDYEAAWTAYANPLTSELAKGMSEEGLVVARTLAHQRLLDAVRAARHLE